MSLIQPQLLGVQLTMVKDRSSRCVSVHVRIPSEDSPGGVADSWAEQLRLPATPPNSFPFTHTYTLTLTDFFLDAASTQS